MHAETLRTLFDDDPTAVCLADADGVVLEGNAAFAVLFGYADAGQARGVRLDTLLVDGADWHRAAAAAVAGATATRLDAAACTTDGRMLLLACRLSRAGDPDLPGAVLARFTDLSEFAQAPRMPIGASPVRAIGHDLGNMMLVIRGFAEILVRELPEGGRARSWAAQILTASGRATALTKELRAAARPPDAGLLDLSPAVVLEALLPLVRRTAGPGIEVDLRVPDGDRSLRTNRDHLEEVLLSLVTLARNHGPKDTRLHVEASWSDAEPPELLLRVSGAEPDPAWEARLLPSPPSG